MNLTAGRSRNTGRGWGPLTALLSALVATTAAAQEAPVRLADGDAVLESAFLLRAPGDVRVVVDFTRIPTGADRVLLEEAGVKILGYVGDRSYVAMIPAGRARWLLALEFVRAAEPYRPEWKGSRELIENPRRRLGLGREGPLRFDLRFHEDVTLEEARAIVLRNGATALHEGFGPRMRIRCEGTEDAVRALLTEEAVVRVDPVAGRRVPMDEVSSGMHGIDAFDEPPYELDGTGVRVGILDYGHPQVDHPDFGDRVTAVGSSNNPDEDHATFVTGVILGSGATLEYARGMAPGAKSWNWSYEDADITFKKILGIPQYDIHVDNNSYGLPGGWEDYGTYWLYNLGPSNLGVYLPEVGDLDEIAYNTGVLMNFAAGNQGNDDGYAAEIDPCAYGYCGPGHFDFNPSTYYIYFHQGSHAPDGGQFRYANLTPEASLKNGITVGAVDSEFVIAELSSAGPTADGRMKPDCVSLGAPVAGTIANDSHAAYIGTTGATAVVTGLSALLVEGWMRTHEGVAPPLDVLKGVILHSCIDLGPEGPDYRYGFGIPWGPYAAALVLDESRSTQPLFARGIIGHGQVREWPMEVSGTDPLRATLCYTDKPAHPSGPGPMVNRLDLVLVDPAGMLHHPWRLDPEDPSALAYRGAGGLDNVKRIDVEEPESGTWTLRVTGTAIPMGEQLFVVWHSERRVNQAPLANAGPDRVVSGNTSAGGPATATGVASFDPDPSDVIVLYQWDTDGDGEFTDAGGSFEGRDLTANFTMGQHTISLRVFDANGASSEDSMILTLRNDPPLPKISGAGVRRALSPDGRVIAMSGDGTTDAQGIQDLVEFKWDLDGDFDYDDSTAWVVSNLFSPGVHDVGFQVRDSVGQAAAVRTTVEVITAESVMRLGGSLKGALGNAEGEDRDSLLFEALAGSTLTVKVKGAFPHSITLWDATETVVHESESDGSGKVHSIKNLSLKSTGWYWLELQPGDASRVDSYALSLSVKPPSIGGTADWTLSPATPARNQALTLLAGSTVSAKAKGPVGSVLVLLDPDGVEVARATDKGSLKSAPVPKTGTYILRLSATVGGELPASLRWKAKSPRGATKIREDENP